MTVTKHEVLTVTTTPDATSIREAIDESVHGDAVLIDMELNDDWGGPMVTLTFRREVPHE